MRLLGRLVMMLIFAGAVAAVVGALVIYSVPQVQDAIFERVAQAGMVQNQGASLLKDDALRAVVCGSSSPMPDPKRAKACIAVLAGGKMYVVDTGPQSYGRVQLLRLPIAQIGGVLYTHFHSDHIADLGEFNMNSWILGRTSPLSVYGPPGVERIVAGFKEAYALDQTYRTAHHGAEIADPAKWEMVAHPIAMPGEDTGAQDRRAIVLEENGLKITAFEVHHDPIKPAYGYRFDYKGRSIVVSGDTAKHVPLSAAASKADVLFHEAQAQHMVEMLQRMAEKNNNTRFAKILSDIRNYHTSPSEAVELGKQAGVKLVVFYHYTPPVLNVVAERMFIRGLNRDDAIDWMMSRDGTMIELPASTTEIKRSELD